MRVSSIIRQGYIDMLPEQMKNQENIESFTHMPQIHWMGHTESNKRTEKKDSGLL